MAAGVAPLNTRAAGVTVTGVEAVEIFPAHQERPEAAAAVRVAAKAEKVRGQVEAAVVAETEVAREKSVPPVEVVARRKVQRIPPRVAGEEVVAQIATTAALKIAVPEMESRCATGLGIAPEETASLTTYARLRRPIKAERVERLIPRNGRLVAAP